jgi:tetratricopeptide (TPR) repeat protein
VYPETKQVAELAIQFDSSLAEAYTSLGATRVFYDWDWEGAERACRKALTINPGYPTGHSFFGGFVLAAQGRLDEAINEISKAQHNDPLSFIIHTAAGVIHWQAGLYEKAFELANQVIESNPRFWLAHALRGLIYEQWESYDAVLDAFQKASDLTFFLAGLQDFDNALQWLEEAVAERSSWTVLINVDPRFGAMKNDPRFAFHSTECFLLFSHVTHSVQGRPIYRFSIYRLR